MLLLLLTFSQKLFLTMYTNCLSSTLQINKEKLLRIDFKMAWIWIYSTQPAFSCPNLAIETLKQGVKYIES